MKQAATVLADRGVLRLRLQRLRFQATPQVVVLAPLVLKRSLRSSLLSSERARRPCRTGGGGCVSTDLVYTLSMMMLAGDPNHPSMGTHVIPWDDWCLLKSFCS